MLDLKFVCENIEEVKQRLANRSGKFDLEGLSELAEERKTLIHRDWEKIFASYSSDIGLISIIYEALKYQESR